MISSVIQKIPRYQPDKKNKNVKKKIKNFIESSGSTKAKEKNKVNIDRISKINIVLKLQESDLTCCDVTLLSLSL